MTIDIEKQLQQLLPIDDRQLITKIAAAGQMMSLKQGTVILDYNQYIKLVPIVLSGVIKVTQQGSNGDILLYYLTAGSTCPTAFTCCRLDKQSDIRAVAEEDAMIMAIPVRYLDEWSQEHIAWKNFMMHSYNTRFKELLHTIDAIAFSKLDERLVNYLKRKVDLTENKTLHIKHKEIAEDLNTTREAISRLLKKMEKLGYLSLSRNVILVKDLDQYV